jgi:S1-C subfamily serine protease
MKTALVQIKSFRRKIWLGLSAVAFITVLTFGLGYFNRISVNTVSANNIFNTEATAGITDPNTVSDEQNNIEVYRAISPGVVLIMTKAERRGWMDEPEENSGTGSGIVIDAAGHILTNEHVVRDSTNLTVNLGGDKVYPAQVVGTDADTDLAVLKIDAPKEVLTVVPVGDSENLQVGQKVLAIGNPFGLDRTLTTGVISGLQRPIRARNNRPIEGAIQTDASINPGNSGGPLLDKNGRLIGVNSQILSASGGSNGIGFAIPVSIVKRVVPQLIQFGEVRRPRLGVGVKSVADLIEQGIRLPVENGLLVMTVAQGSAAEKAGLRATSRGFEGEVRLGDIITAVNGEKVMKTDDLYRILDQHQVDETVHLEIFRDQKKTTVAVKLQSNAGIVTEKKTGKTNRQPRQEE